VSEPRPGRHKHESPVRRRQAAATRESILAGAELLHGFPVWTWSGLTVPAVAERAGVVTDWHLDLEQALRGVTWVIRMIEGAIRASTPPADAPGPST
jgi:hypothetical protein